VVRPFDVVVRDVPVAELVGVSKVFGATLALDDVSLALRRGEVLGLVGENGAGKSTCAKILGGVYRPDAGELRLAGKPAVLDTPMEAHSRGVAVVHQNPSLFPDLSIAENVFAGQPMRGFARLLDHGAMRQEASRWLQMLGLRLDPGAPAGSLRTSEQQLVEVARALASDARVIILDEPTASLSTGDVERLFAVIADLRAHGVALMFVGHRLGEVFRMCDRIAVLRDGTLVDARPVGQLTEREAVRLMVGRELNNLNPKRKRSIGDSVLELEHVSSRAGVDDVSFRVRRGEIVGLAGLLGSGRTEVARALFGIDRLTAGRILLRGKDVHLRSAADALAHGIAYLSEDRRGQSLIEEFSILENATLPIIQQTTRFALVAKRAQMALITGSLQLMKLKFQSYDQPVATLSGGNQQKVVVAKWLATNPTVLILDEPTQGIDVQAKAQVHQIIAGLADQGLAILMISSDMPELLGMCDRILVMRESRIAAEFDREQASQFDIALAATGVGADTGSGDRARDVSPAAVRQPDSTSASVNRAPDASKAAAGRSQRNSGRSPAAGEWLWRHLAARREMGLIVALVTIVIPISVANPRFLDGENLTAMGSDTVLIGIVALGQLVVMLTRNIDLSVGSTIGLAGYVSAAALAAHPRLPLVIPVLLACGVGTGCGLVNGLVVAYGRVPSIVVTLGTLAVYRGIDSIIANGKEVAASQVPQGWLNLTGGTYLGIPALVWIGVVLSALVGGLLRWTARGRETYAVGSNPEGAGLIGISAQRRVLMAYLASGLLAGFDGAVWASHYATVDGQLAYGLELTVVASVVVGGVALRGGQGTVLGVAVGTFALVAIQNGLTIVGLNDLYLQAFYGAAILLAVTIDLIVARRAQAAGRSGR
jgi:rhamnose transport system ATP-binding protein